MGRPDATAACCGESITVHDGLGITGLTLEVAGIPNAEGDLDLGFELELARPEVERLRDRLTAWLDRGTVA